MKVLLLDAFDSFVFTIAQYYMATGAETRTIRVNDRPVDQYHDWQPDLLVLGPGPGTPEDHGYLALLSVVPESQAVFGVCLGHQAIGQHFGWTLGRAPKVQHGTYSEISHDGQGIFRRVPARTEVVRYHSLVITPGAGDSALRPTAMSQNDDVVMAVRHSDRPIEGVQFHPESVGTAAGPRIISNSLDLALSSRMRRSDPAQQRVWSNH